MNSKEENSRSKVPSLVTTAGSGPIPKGHVPLEESSISTFSQWVDAELVALEHRFREFATHTSVKNSIGR